MLLSLGSSTPNSCGMPDCRTNSPSDRPTSASRDFSYPIENTRSRTGALESMSIRAWKTSPTFTSEGACTASCTGGCGAGWDGSIAAAIERAELRGWVAVGASEGGAESGAAAGDGPRGEESGHANPSTTTAPAASATKAAPRVFLESMVPQIY